MSAADELQARAKTALETLTGRGRKPLADPFQLAVLAAAVQNMLIRKGICTQDEFDLEVLTVQADQLEAMVAATAAPLLVVPSSVAALTPKN